MANLSVPKFFCDECGRHLPSSRLSDYSLKLSGATTKAQAVHLLDPAGMVCDICIDDDEKLFFDDDEIDLSFFGRNDRERFDFDGVYVDQGKLTAHMLNY